MSGQEVVVLHGEGQNVVVNLQALKELLPKLFFLRFYDAADPGPVDAVRPADWGIPSLLAAPLSWRALEQATPERIAGIEAALADVRSEWRLEDEDPERDRRAAVRRLMSEACAIPGIKSATATKLLHKKRPNLIPIVDSVVLDFYGSTLLPTDLMFDRLRPDLLVNYQTAAAIALAASRFSLPRQVSPLRAIELCVWLQQSMYAAEVVCERQLI